MSPNDYELGYDEGYQDASDMIHLRKQIAEIDKLARQWKARAEKAEAALREIDRYNDSPVCFDKNINDILVDALKETGQ